MWFATRDDTQRAEPAGTTTGAPAPSAASNATSGSDTTLTGDVGATGATTLPFTVDAHSVFYFAAAPDCTDSGLQWVVEDSAGTGVSGAAVMCGDIGRVSLPEGDYRVRVFAAAGGAGGPFSFVRKESRDDRILTIESGQKVEGNIDLPGAQDIYTFSVTAGTVGYFASDGCSANGPQWTIETDAGSPASGGAIICGDLGRVEFPDAGSFRMRVFSAGGSTGSYALEWKPSRPDKILAISSGQTVDGDLDLPGARDVLTFDVDAGEVAYFAGSHDCSANDRYWVVEDAANAVVSPTSGICDDIGRVAFATAGSYHLRVVSSDGATGAYSVTWRASRPDKVRDLVPGSSSGSIELPGSRDVWTFSAQEGRTVTFSADAACTATQVLWLVQAADGTAISTPNVICNDLGAVTLPHAGEYQIIVSGNGDATGDYSFHAG